MDGWGDAGGDAGGDAEARTWLAMDLLAPVHDLRALAAVPGPGGEAPPAVQALTDGLLGEHRPELTDAALAGLLDLERALVVGAALEVAAAFVEPEVLVLVECALVDEACRLSLLPLANAAADLLLELVREAAQDGDAVGGDAVGIDDAGSQRDEEARGEEARGEEALTVVRPGARLSRPVRRGCAGAARRSGVGEGRQGERWRGEAWRGERWRGERWRGERWRGEGRPAARPATRACAARGTRRRGRAAAVIGHGGRPRGPPPGRGRSSR